VRKKEVLFTYPLSYPQVLIKLLTTLKFEDFKRKVCQ